MWCRNLYLLKNRAITLKDLAGGIGLIQGVGAACSQTFYLNTSGGGGWGWVGRHVTRRGVCTLKTSSLKLNLSEDKKRKAMQVCYIIEYVVLVICMCMYTSSQKWLPPVRIALFFNMHL